MRKVKKGNCRCGLERRLRRLPFEEWNGWNNIEGMERDRTRSK